MALMTVETVFLMAFQTEIMISLQFSQIKRNGKVMMSNAACRIAPINWMPTETTFLMVSQMSEKKDTIPFQIFEKKVVTDVHSASQLVPNHPRNTSAIPFSILRAAVRIPVTPFQMPENISLMPFHICDQFPVNSPINTSRMPTMTSRTVPSTVLITEKAASNTGARTWQKPSHTAFSTSTMFWKSKPRAFNRCVIASPKAANFSLMPSHIPVMALRNSSLVSHKCLKAATNTATIATTASTGPATVPSALPREVIEPLLPAIFTPSFATPFVRDEKVFMVVPTVDMVLPRTMSRGPRAAATAMIFTTACFSFRSVYPRMPGSSPRHCGQSA